MNHASNTAVYRDQLEGVNLERDCPCGAPATYALLTGYVEGDGVIATDVDGELAPYVCEECAPKVTAASEIGNKLKRLRYGEARAPTQYR